MHVILFLKTLEEVEGFLEVEDQVRKSIIFTFDFMLTSIFTIGKIKIYFLWVFTKICIFSISHSPKSQAKQQILFA